MRTTERDGAHGGDTDHALAAVAGDAGTAVSRFSAAAYRWAPGQVITWSLATLSFDRGDFDTQLPASWLDPIQQAFAAWAAVSTLQFQQALFDSVEVDIRLGGVASLDGENNTLAQASTVFVGDEIQTADIVFDLAEDWTLQPDGSGRVSVFTTALHEIGHALGLSHEDRVPAVMNAFYDEDITGLLPDDVTGIQALYGPPGGPVPGAPPDTDDLVVGTAGDDMVSAGADAERVWGIQGDDTLAGGLGDDSLFGNAGNDSLAGEGGDDTIRGQFGEDRLDGGAGSDMLFGGAGDDQVNGGDGDDTVNGNAGFDTVRGGAGDDAVRGQGNADQLFGEAGNDTLSGHAGPDTLSGGDGADRLVGGEGDDSLAGGAGADVFVFAAQQGTDTIADFAPGLDLISIVGFAGFDALDIVDDAAGAVVTFEPVPTTRIILEGIFEADLSAGDFMFT